MAHESPNRLKFFTRADLENIITAAGELPKANRRRRKLLATRLEEYAAALVRDFYWHLDEPRRRAEAKRGKLARGRGRRKNEAVNHFVQDLLGLWVEFFEADFGTSVAAPGRKDAGQATGPLVRFLDACCSGLRERLERSAIRGIPHDLSEAIAARLRGLTPNALRRRVQRTGWPAFQGRPRGNPRTSTN